MLSEARKAGTGKGNSPVPQELKLDFFLTSPSEQNGKDMCTLEWSGSPVEKHANFLPSIIKGANVF